MCGRIQNQKKHYLCNKTTNINVQNISLYTRQRRHAKTDKSKTAKIIKNDIIQQHIDN